MKNAAPITDEQEQQSGKLEPSEHLENNPGNNLDLIFLSRAPLRCLKDPQSLFYQAVKSIL